MEKKKCYYDESVLIDTSSLPIYLQEVIKELEECSFKQDEIMYDMNFEVLEGQAKSFLINGKITESDFHKLMRKYRWYVDE